jgi:hypothetical protein
MGYLSNLLRAHPELVEGLKRLILQQVQNERSSTDQIFLSYSTPKCNNCAAQKKSPDQQ